jgi:hypothetical protein
VIISAASVVLPEMPNNGFYGTSSGHVFLVFTVSDNPVVVLMIPAFADTPHMGFIQEIMV